jgi:uncharacterized protein with HEPN domain
MPSERSLRALSEILDNAMLAQRFVEGLTAETFAADRKTFYAVTRCLEIISEASRRLDDDVRASHPRLPWKQIMAAGNVYRHAYDNVAESLVWRTVHDRLPELIAAAQSELNR